MRSITPLILLISSALMAQTGGTVQPNVAPFVFGEVLTFPSRELGQERVLNVHLPEGYADSTLNYPVI